jgi:hypothetical protein
MKPTQTVAFARRGSSSYGLANPATRAHRVFVEGAAIPNAQPDFGRALFPDEMRRAPCVSRRASV